MTTIESVQAASGAWKGVSRLYLYEEPVRESAVTATVTAAIQGTYSSIAYAWAFDGKPQEGLLMLAKDPGSSAVKALFLDSFHMNESFMVLPGSVDAQGKVDVLGSYSVDGSEPWGWRITVEAGAHDLKVAMFNISPEGQEYPGFDLICAH